MLHHRKFVLYTNLLRLVPQTQSNFVKVPYTVEENVRVYCMLYADWLFKFFSIFMKFFLNVNRSVLKSATV